MKKIFYPENDIKINANIGGKAKNLFLLSRNCQVPEWICVPVACFKLFLETTGLDDKIKSKIDNLSGNNIKKTAEDIQALILAEALPKDMLTEIKEVIKKLFKDDFISVRSSAADEDSASHSFAGIHESFLFIKGAESVAEHIKKVWASGYQQRALSYRLENKLPLHPVPMAVILQKMIDAKSSGVVFTADPTTGNPHKLVISSLYGLGEGLVSAGLNADLIEYDKASGEFHETIAKKVSLYTFNKKVGEGIKKIPVTPKEQELISLSSKQLQKITETSLEIEKTYGQPQDIEFCFDSAGKLFILQTRPITTIKEYGPAAGNRLIWDNSNIIESYSGVTSPMTFSFIRRAYTIVYHCFSQVMGISTEKVQKNQHVFENMLGIFRGQVYYNIVNWYRLVHLFPGFNYNKGFMESMMGLREKIDLGDETSKRTSAFSRYFIELPALFKLLGRSAWNFMTIRKKVTEFDRHFNKHYKKWEAMDFNNMPPHALMDLYKQMENALLWNWKTPIINDFFVMIFYGSLKKRCRDWCNDQTGSLQNDLICGEGGIESTEPTKLLMKISLTVKQNNKLTKLFLTEKAAKLAKIIPKKTEFIEINNQIDNYLDLYGFRCMNELKLEEPSLREKPEFIYQMIQNYLKLKDDNALNPESKDKQEQQIRKDAEKRAFDAIKISFIPRKIIFKWILINARLGVKNRENMRFARTRIYGLLRELINSVGAFFLKEDLIDIQHDIFYLTIDEVWDYIKGTAVTTNLRGLIKLRKEEFDYFRNEKTPIPDDHFETFGLAYSHNLFQDWTQTKEEAKEGELQGTACCPGIVKNKVKVLRSPSDEMELNGEILVASRTDPGWVPLYPAVSGILIERGSILSHSAIVAREMGIPAIVGIPNLLETIKDGQIVEMNGQSGIVKTT